MSSFGLLETGFSLKTIEDILLEIKDSQKALLGPEVNTSPQSVIGQLNGIFANQLAELWEVASAVYSSQYLDSATGVALDNLAALVGVFRQQASFSVATLTVDLNLGTTLTSETKFAVIGSGAVFRAIEPFTAQTSGTHDIRVAAAEIGPVVALAGQIATVVSGAPAGLNQTAAEIQTGNPGTPDYDLSAPSFLPADFQIRIDDRGTQTLIFTETDFPNPAAVTASDLANAFESKLDPLGANAVDVGPNMKIFSDTTVGFSSLQVIGGTMNTVLGFDTEKVYGTPSNFADAIEGRPIQTDASYRNSINQTLARTGAGTVNAITADMSLVPDIANVIVNENDLSFVSPEFLPPNSVQIILYDVAAVQDEDRDQEIAQAILGTVAAGIETALIVPSITSAIQEPYDFTSGTYKLLFRIDGGEPQGFTVNQASTTAAEVAADIQANITGVNAFDASGFVQVDSASDGSVTIELVNEGGGDLDANSKLGFENVHQAIVQDSVGNDHIIRFQRVSTIAVYVEVSVEAERNAFDGIDDTEKENAVRAAVTTAIKAEIDEHIIGEDLKAARIQAAAFDVDGITDINNFDMGKTGLPSGPGEPPVVIAPNEKAIGDTGNITINVDLI